MNSKDSIKQYRIITAIKSDWQLGKTSYFINNLNNNITTMLQTERQALHYKVIARQLVTLYNDSYINNNEINRNLKKLERYYDELKLYLDK